MLKNIIKHIKINGIGYILALTLFGCMFLFFEIWREGFMGALAEARKQGAFNNSFKYLPYACGFLFFITFLKRMYKRFLK